MFVLSITKIIEEAVSSDASKNLSGNIESFDALFRKESLDLLEERHKGLFAYLAFHPRTDEAIVAYMMKDTLSSDSGPNILVLFTLDGDAKWATAINENSFGKWMNLDTTIHPSYQLIRILFANKPVPPLPGIAFFERFTTNREPVYVSLQGLKSEAQVLETLRTIFSLAEHAFIKSKEKPGTSFADSFSVELQKKKLQYYKLGPTSMMEWLVKAYQTVLDNKGDIVSAIGLFT